MAGTLFTLKLNPMEREYVFAIYYGRDFLKYVTAHTKWEAVEIIYSRLICEFPNLNRGDFKAKKL